MTITPEEHDYIGAVIAADAHARRAKTIPIPSQGSDIIEAWKASQAFAAYGDQEDIRETFFMGWNAGVGEIDRVRKECQALQERLNVADQLGSDLSANAKRYEYMRVNSEFKDRNGPGLYWYLPRYQRGSHAEQLDSAIDAAMETSS